MSELVSIIIPCYKQAHFLGEAVESVLAQTYQHFEIIVVDDGSPDDVEAVTKKYPTVKLIRQNNRGVSAARNTGMRESEGRYFIFLDADDRLLPHALETNLRLLEGRPECAYAAGRIRKIATDGTPIPTQQLPRSLDEHYADLMRSDRTGRIIGLLFRKEVFDSVGGFDESLRAAEDFDLYLRVTKRFPIIYHDEIVAEYRRHVSNTTNDKNLMYRSVMHVLRRQRRHVRGNEFYENAYREGVRNRKDYYSNLIVNDVRASVRAGRWGRAVNGTRKLVTRHPRVLIRHVSRKTKLHLAKIFSRLINAAE